MVTGKNNFDKLKRDGESERSLPQDLGCTTTIIREHELFWTNNGGQLRGKYFWQRIKKDYRKKKTQWIRNTTVPVENTTKNHKIAGNKNPFARTKKNDMSDFTPLLHKVIILQH